MSANRTHRGGGSEALATQPGRVARRPDTKLPPGVDVVQGDITEPESLPAAVEGVEVVIHCAAITGGCRRNCCRNPPRRTPGEDHLRLSR